MFLYFRPPETMKLLMGLQSKESNDHSDLDFEENFQQKEEKIKALIQELKEKT